MRDESFPQRYSYRVKPPLIEQAILRQLMADYRQIVFQFRLKLRPPVIIFTENTSLWGRWNSLHRTIEIQRQLVEKHSWDTVLYVLKHEIAHQIVGEIFGLSEHDHGESFQKACDLLALPPEFRRGTGDIVSPSQWREQSTKTEAITRVIEKIQKLFALASSTNSEAEAGVAMARARELSRKYDIHETVLGTDSEEFRYIVINTGKQRLSPLYSHLSSLLMDHYSVDVIFTSTFSAQTLKPSQCLEIYGRETHVVVAEYVLQFLLKTLDDLWRAHARGKKLSAVYKKSYQIGIVAGFKERLQKEEQLLAHAENPAKVHNSLMVIEERRRQEYIQLRYPRLRSRSTGSSWIDNETYAHGVVDGRDVQIRKGLKKNATQNFLLKGSVLG